MDECTANLEATSEDDLRKEIEELENEKKRIRDEFNIQRAKMKELFLQKESELSAKKQENVDLKRELDEVKNHLIERGKAEEEIASLQKLVHETIEESSCSKTYHDNEIERLRLIIQELQLENGELRKQQHSPHHIAAQDHTLGPGNVLNALTKGIVKKLGADSFSSTDSLDDNSKKSCDDNEVLRSLVEPLEEQIKALKEKLRSTDEQLQKCRECGHDGLETSSSTSQTEKETTCDMCRNYEAQLVNEQKKYDALSVKAHASEKAIERHREELVKEIGFRKEMEEKWNQKREEMKAKVAELSRSTEFAELDLRELRQMFAEKCSEFRNALTKLTQDREKIHQEIKLLQAENDNLIGKYTVHSQVLQSQAIDLPNTVEELHELILKNTQELIIAKIGKESAESTVSTLQSSIAVLQEQIENQQRKEDVTRKDFMQTINDLKDQNNHLEREIRSYMSNKEKISELQEQINELLTSKKQLVELNSELKSRVSALQQELDTSETVQKDFVLLSQSLQVQLEKIRASDSQVRWQHEDDVDGCPACHAQFGGAKKKQHCRHCGQIFCQNCLTKMVESGPNMRPSKVCDVCHTLLVQSSAPYFSEAPPPT